MWLVLIAEILPCLGEVICLCDHYISSAKRRERKEYFSWFSISFFPLKKYDLGTNGTSWIIN